MKTFVASLLLLCTPLLVLHAGVTNVFVLDDWNVLVDNTDLHGESPTLDGLLKAATSKKIGLTGRPLVLGSFYLQNTAGSDQASSYKKLNALIHGLNGALLLVALRLLLTRIGTPPPRALLVATIFAALWTVHPVHVSTVLYSVQRMTLLAGTFSLLAIILYLCRTQVTTFAAIGVAGLGVFAKAVSIIAIPITTAISLQLQQRGQERDRKSVHIALVTVTILIGIGGLFITLDSLQAFDRLPFSPIERLLTQTRVLVFYATQVFFPEPSRLALFNDHFIASTSLFSPVTTLFSSIMLTGAVILVCANRMPLLSRIGIAWFLLGHVVESGALPLELAFEHRNYFPSIGLFVALMPLTEKTSATRYIPTMAIAFAIGSLLVALSVSRASSWSTEGGLLVTQLEHRPTSPRAHQALALFIAEHDPANIATRSIPLIDQAAALDARSLTPAIQAIVVRADQSLPIPDKILAQVLDVQRTETLDKQALPWLRRLAINENLSSHASAHSTVDNLLAALVRKSRNSLEKSRLLAIVAERELLVMRDPVKSLRVALSAHQARRKDPEFTIFAAELAVLNKNPELAKTLMDSLNDSQLSEPQRSRTIRLRSLLLSTSSEPDA